jgi:hypothetical protein
MHEQPVQLSVNGTPIAAQRRTAHDAGGLPAGQVRLVLPVLRVSGHRRRSTSARRDYVQLCHAAVNLRHRLYIDSCLAAVTFVTSCVL